MNTRVVAIAGALLILAVIAITLAMRNRNTTPQMPGPSPATAQGVDAPEPVVAPPVPSAFSVEGLGGEPEELVAAEVASSAAAPPPETYVGPDGRRQKFEYSKPGLDARQLDREARKKLLMAELTADPAAFAAAYGLNPKQVRWIADGEAEFPEELLD